TPRLRAVNPRDVVRSMRAGLHAKEEDMELPISSLEPVWDCIQAARFLRLHPKTVKRMARLGQIPGTRLGRRGFSRPSDSDAVLRRGVSSSSKANRVAPQLSSNLKRRG